MSSSETFDKAFRQSAWIMGHPIQDRDPGIYRADDFGEAIRFDKFGDADSEFGWDIDPVTGRPVNCRSNSGLEKSPADNPRAYRAN